MHPNLLNYIELKNKRLKLKDLWNIGNFLYRLEGRFSSRTYFIILKLNIWEIENFKYN